MEFDDFSPEIHVVRNVRPLLIEEHVLPVDRFHGPVGQVVFDFQGSFVKQLFQDVVGVFVVLGGVQNAGLQVHHQETVFWL